MLKHAASVGQHPSVEFRRDCELDGAKPGQGPPEFRGEGGELIGALPLTQIFKVGRFRSLVSTWLVSSVRPRGMEGRLWHCL